jgi:hypothetical protein
MHHAQEKAYESADGSFANTDRASGAKSPLTTRPSHGSRAQRGVERRRGVEKRAE